MDSWSVVGMAGSAVALVPLFVLLALLAVDRWVYVDSQAHAESNRQDLWMKIV
jgi:hypothetical protein